jgi:uncharacterized membrane protein YebE (DUF533 family)
MDVSSILVRAVVDGVLSGGRKHSRKTRKYLGARSADIWSNPQTLLTAAGLAWGVYETLGAAGPSGGHGGDVHPSTRPFPSAPPGADPPPLPRLEVEPDGPISAPALRLLRLAISAGNADGALSDRERTLILEQARAVDAEEVASRELGHPMSVRDIVADVSSTGDAATLYVLAFTILRADEQVTAPERVYLAQLAHLLQLDRATVDALERDTATRIDASPE